MNPTQCVEEDVELSSIITQHDQIWIDIVGKNTAQQSSLGYDLNVALANDAPLPKLGCPFVFVRNRGVDELFEDTTKFWWEPLVTHVFEGIRVEDIVRMPRA
jgi:hypothetical protein